MYLSQDFPVKVREQKDGRLIAKFEGGSRLIFGQEEAMGLRLQLDGKTVVLPNIFDPRFAYTRFIPLIHNGKISYLYFRDDPSVLLLY